MIGEAAAGIAAAAAAVAALAALWRYTHAGELLRGTRRFLVDWNGEEPRPGFDGRRSFPERMSGVEARVQSIDHYGRDYLGGRVEAVRLGVDELKRTAQQTADDLERVDARVTDHRIRNEQQITLLQQAVELRLSAVERELQARRFRHRKNDDDD